MTHTLKQLGVKAVVALGLGLSAWTSSEGQRLVWSGVPSPGGYALFFRPAISVSDTGVVVGSTRERAFRMQNGDIEYLALPSGYSSSSAVDISADGRVIVGEVWHSSGNRRVVRWVNGQPEILQQLYSVSAVSADGSTVVGPYQLWQNGNVVQIPLEGVDVSADGSIVAGIGYGSEPVRWTSAGGVEVLPTDYGDFFVSGISGNGEVVIGSRTYDLGASTGFSRRGVFWATSCQPYCVFFSLYHSAHIPLGVSHDGDVIVGYGYWIETDDSGFPSLQHYSFIYRRQWGEARTLSSVYPSLLSDGSELYPNSVSPNGRYIAGVGYNATRQRYEAFLLDTQVSGDVNGDGCVDDADLLAVLFNFGQSGSGLPEDVNSDGVVDDADLLEVLFNFGSGC